MGRAKAIEGVERRAARREELLDAAIRCIRKAGPGVSMERIAAEAGVTKPILYRHFRDRADLQDAIATRFTDAIGKELRGVMRRTGKPRLVLESAIDSYVRLVERDTDIYRFLVHRGRPSVAVEGAIEHFMRRLGTTSGSFWADDYWSSAWTAAPPRCGVTASSAWSVRPSTGGSTEACSPGAVWWSSYPSFSGRA